MSSTTNGASNGATNGAAHASNWVPVNEVPALTRRKLKLVCIGAGYSGLTLAHKIQHEHKLEDVIDLQIYDKNPDVGGTWYENRYPGAACDIPSHGYTFLFQPNPDWSKFYSGGPEIHAYIKKTTAKWGLDKHVQLNSKILETVWDNEVGKWKITIDHNGTIEHDEADILVNGAGFLNKWKWPAIPGLHNFKGKLVHSATWDNSYQWEGKKVAVIGNGSSGIQLVAAMQPKASKLTTYIRNPTWVSVNFCGELAKNGANFDYTEEEKKTFRENPKAHQALRKQLEESVNRFYFGMKTGHPAQEGLEAMCKASMLEIMKANPEMADKWIPNFHPGCRRLSPGDGYLEALQQPNAKTIWSPIEAITETGIRTAEGEEEFDIIVCATGFDTSFIPPWKLVGLNGATLEERWKTEPQAFLAVQVDTMPNYFIYNGPNCPISNGSVLTCINWMSDYVLRWAEKIATQDIKSVTPKAQSVVDYNIYQQENLKGTVWADNCRSWYKNGKTSGSVTGPYGGTVLHFKAALENVGNEHFNIAWRSKNPFSWLGNGQSLIDKDGMGDVAYYIDEEKSEQIDLAYLVDKVKV